MWTPSCHQNQSNQIKPKYCRSTLRVTCSSMQNLVAMVNRQIVSPRSRVRPNFGSKVCLAKRNSDLVQWDMSSIDATDASRKAGLCILGLEISQVGSTLWHACIPWIQKIWTESCECMKQQRCTSRLTLVPSLTSSKVHTWPRYRRVPKRRSSIGETLLLFLLPVKKPASVCHRSNNPSQLLPPSHSKIWRYDP
jgi:hypothetical protein